MMWFKMTYRADVWIRKRESMITGKSLHQALSLGSVTAHILTVWNEDDDLLGVIPDTTMLFTDFCKLLADEYGVECDYSEHPTYQLYKMFGLLASPELSVASRDITRRILIHLRKQADADGCHKSTERNASRGSSKAPRRSRRSDKVNA